MIKQLHKGPVPPRHEFWGVSQTPFTCTIHIRSQSLYYIAQEDLNSMVKSSPRSPPLHTDNTGVPTRLSPHWFFPDGDLFLRCNSILYLVHSKVLSSASGVFRDALQRPAPTPHLPSYRLPISGTGKCRTHSKSNLKMALNQQLSLSTRFWLRQTQRRYAMGKPVKRWGGKATRVPKVLVVEDREVNVDYLLYFLYSRPYVEW